MTVSTATLTGQPLVVAINQRALLCLLAVSVCLSGCAATYASPATDALFEEHTVITGNARHQTVLSGFFLGGDFADLLIVYSEADSRRLEVFAFDGGQWMSAIEADLGPEVLFVDVARISGRDRLLMYEEGHISWFDSDALIWRELLEVVTRYSPHPDGLHYGGFESRQPFDEGEIPRVDVTRDLNGDGSDDIVLPDVDGFWVAVQTVDGRFTEAEKIGPAEPFRDAVAQNETRSYGEVGITPLTAPLYLSRIHQMDYNQDGRTDLVFWNESQLDVHLQQADGAFSTVARSFAVGPPIDTDGDYSIVFLSGKVNFASLVGLRKKRHLTVLRALVDVNGDGVADLLTHSLNGRSLLRQRSRYAVHFGTQTSETVSFSEQPSAAARPRSKAGGLEAGGYSSLWLRDVDDDGQVDILRGDVKIGPVAMIRALLGRSISMRAELFRMNDGTFPERPSMRRTVRSDLSLRGGRDAGFFPSVLVGDVNGDRRSDVLIGKNSGTLHVYLGVSGPELLARQPVAVQVALPGDERNSWFADLNGDTKQDLVLHQPSAEGPHRVTLLIAR